MADNHRVIFAQGNLGEHALAVRLTEIFWIGSQHVRCRVHAREFTTPLRSQMVGYHQDRLARNAQALVFHDDSGTHKGFTGTDRVIQQQVAVLNSSPYRRLLVFAQDDGRVGAVQHQMITVIFPVHCAVVLLVEQLGQLLGAHAVVPYPRFPSLLDLVDLLACRLGGFGVRHKHLFAVAHRFHLHFWSLAVHHQLQQIERCQVFGAVVVTHLANIAAVIDVTKPLCGCRQISQVYLG